MNSWLGESCVVKPNSRRSYVPNTCFSQRCSALTSENIQMSRENPQRAGLRGLHVSHQLAKDGHMLFCFWWRDGHVALRERSVALFCGGVDMQQIHSILHDSNLRLCSPHGAGGPRQLRRASGFPLVANDKLLYSLWLIFIPCHC